MLQGLSCIFQKVATWLRKHVWCQVFLYCSYLPEITSLTAGDKILLSSHVAEKARQWSWDFVWGNLSLITQLWNELERNSGFRHSDGVKPHLYQPHSWWEIVDIKSTWKPPKLAIWYGRVMEIRRNLCYRRLLGGSSAKDSRNPCWTFGQETSCWRIKLPVIFSQ